MNVKNLIPLMAATALALSASAFAGDWYVTGSIGRSSWHLDGAQTDLDSSLVANGLTGVSSNLKKEGTGYKVQLGYELNRYFAVEGGYVDLGKAKYAATFTGGSDAVEFTARGWNIDAIGSIPLGQDFSLFGKAGLINAKKEVSFTATGAASLSSGKVSATNWKPTWGIGANYNVSKNVSLRGEFERFSKLGHNNSTGDSTGENDVDLWSLGMVYKF